MSRGYRVVVRQTADRHVKSKDEMDVDISVLGILPEGEMNELLDQALREDGWKKGEGGRLTKRFGDVTAEIAEDKKTVTIRAEAEATVTATAPTKADAKARADEKAEKAKDALQVQVTQTLTEAEAQVREDIQGGLQRVYVQALEKKARQMGEVESIDKREHEGEIELVIKVKV